MAIASAGDVGVRWDWLGRAQVSPLQCTKIEESVLTAPFARVHLPAGMVCTPSPGLHIAHSFFVLLTRDCYHSSLFIEVQI